MAKAKDAGSSLRQRKPKVKRKNIHSKKRTSSLKTSKVYKKLYRGQGK